MNESALENYYFRPVWVQAFVQVRLIKLVLHCYSVVSVST